MHTPQLGKLIDSPQQRDAVHIAIVPLIAGEHLDAGEKFRLAYGTKNIALRGDYNEDSEVAGVVDPFLPGWGGVEKGQEFWGLLFPNTVTGMRHEWFNPTFDEPAVGKDEHEKWLRGFCDRWNFNFDELITAGVGANPDWRCVVARGIDLHSATELGEDEQLFWEHLEKFTQKTFSQEHRNQMGWSCTC